MFKKYNENRLTTVCKIGKTDEHHPELRMHVYTKKCKILIIYDVLNASFVEREIKKTFKLFFKKRSDLGTEYFEGSAIEMKREFLNTCVKFQEYIDEFNVMNCIKSINGSVDDNDSCGEECYEEYFNEHIKKSPCDALSWKKLLLEYREWYEINFEDGTLQNKKVIQNKFSALFKKEIGNHKNIKNESVYGWKGFCIVD